MIDEAIAIQSISQYIDIALHKLTLHPLEERIILHEITSVARDLLGNGYGPFGVLALAMANLGYGTPHYSDGVNIYSTQIHTHYNLYLTLQSIEGHINMAYDRNMSNRPAEVRLQGRLKALTQIINVLAPTLE